MTRELRSVLEVVVCLGLVLALTHPGVGQLKPGPGDVQSPPKRQKPTPKPVRSSPQRSKQYRPSASKSHRRPAPKGEVPKLPSPPAWPGDLERLAAKSWLQSEQTATASSIALLDRLPVPAALQPLWTVESNEAETRSVQKVRLEIRREDGAPMGSDVTGSLLEVDTPAGVTASATSTPFVLELDYGDRVPKSSPVRLHLKQPTEWEFVRPEDATLMLSKLEGTMVRQVIHQRATGGIQPLFSDAQQREEHRRSVAPMFPRAQPEPGAPTPARMCARALELLGTAREQINRAIRPPLPLADAVQRSQRWSQLETAASMLTAAEAAFDRSRQGLLSLDNLAQSRGRQGPQAVLRHLVLFTDAEWNADYRRLRDTVGRSVSSGRLRATQYQAEVIWWQASFENPNRPDRHAALEVLRGAQLQPWASPELKDQLVHYEEHSRRERMRVETSAAGVTELFTYTVNKPIQLRRTVIDLRVSKVQLREGDQAFLVGDDRVPIEFQFHSSYWRARIPRSAAKPGTRLAARRTRADTVLEAGAELGAVDPYRIAGNELILEPWRLTAIRNAILRVGPTFAVEVMDLLPPVRDKTAPLVWVRGFSSPKEVKALPDGSWWARRAKYEDHKIKWRLRPSPFHAQPVMDESDRRDGWVIVEEISLEEPKAGQVGGVQVGTSRSDLELAFGGSVPEDGVVEYQGGGVAFELHAGTVSSVRIRRRLKELLSESALVGVPGTVTRLDRDNGLLWADCETNVEGQPLLRGVLLRPGSMLEIQVAGKPVRSVHPNRRFYAEVVSVVGPSQIQCRIVERLNRTYDSAPSWFTERLPLAETRAIVMCPPPSN